MQKHLAHLDAYTEAFIFFLLDLVEKPGKSEPPTLFAAPQESPIHPQLAVGNLVSPVWDWKQPINI